MAHDKELVNYLIETFDTNERPRILTSGGVYIWNAKETKILAGPFDSTLHAAQANGLALNKAIKKVNKRPMPDDPSYGFGGLHIDYVPK